MSRWRHVRRLSKGWRRHIRRAKRDLAHGRQRWTAEEIRRADARMDRIVAGINWIDVPANDNPTDEALSGSIGEAPGG